MSFSDIVECAISDTELQEYEPRLTGVFTTVRKLHTAINESSTTALDIAKWTWQITECLRYMYVNRGIYPVEVDPKSLCVNSAGDVVYNSVLRSRNYYSSKNGIPCDAMFMDIVFRVHGSLISCLDGKKINNRPIVLLGILGEYFYAGAAIKSNTYTTSKACDFAGQLCEMVHLGLLDKLSEVLK